MIRQTGPMQRLLFGRGSTELMSERGRMLLDACLKGGIAAQLSPDIQREIWQKYVFIVGLSGDDDHDTQADRTDPRRSPRRARSCSMFTREVVAVGRAHGIDLPTDYAEQRLVLTDDFSSALGLMLFYMCLGRLGTLTTNAQGYLRIPIGVGLSVLLLGYSVLAKFLSCSASCWSWPGVAAMTIPAGKYRLWLNRFRQLNVNEP